MKLTAFKPAVPKNWLTGIAGLVWSLVGILLCRLAIVWLRTQSMSNPAVFAIAGLVLAIVAHRLMFARIARKNISRIDHYADKGCLFAFQAWRSYLIIVVMVLMGITLRHSAFPRRYLAVLYLGMGGALLLASSGYYRHLWAGRSEGRR